MKSSTRKALILASGVLLQAHTVLAADSVASHLGPVAGIAGDIQTYVYYLAIFVCIISLLIIWATGNLARAANKIEEALNARRNKQGWIIDAFIVLVAFVFLFGYVIPKLSALLGVA